MDPTYQTITVYPIDMPVMSFVGIPLSGTINLLTHIKRIVNTNEPKTTYTLTVRCADYMDLLVVF